jgi:hypothetical protein
MDVAWSRPNVLQHERKFNCILPSADGSRANTGDAGGVLRVRDAGTGVLSPDSSWICYRNNSSCGRML